MQKIEIKTLFDITKTEIVRNFKPSLLQNNGPFKNKKAWIKARRQQSNWETLIQVISLRSNPFNILTPTYKKQDLTDFGYYMFYGLVWEFSFNIETENVFHDGSNPVGLLLDDLNNVPMISGLDENVVNCDYFKTAESQINIIARLV